MNGITLTSDEANRIRKEYFDDNDDYVMSSFKGHLFQEMTIHNRFNDEHYQQSAKLPAFAVAIYDTIIGSEMSEDYDTMQKGLTWFQKNFTDAYFKLLD